MWLLIAALFAASALACAQQQQPAPEPPEEDETLKAKEYAFNPLQAEKEIKVGDFYFKKGSFKAAALRYEEATRWNPSSAEAFLKLGRAQQKLKNEKAALEAYRKYVALAPESKTAQELRKRFGLAP